MSKILFILITSFASNSCMQQALALREDYSPQQVATELLPSFTLPARAKTFLQKELAKESDKKSYSPADAFDLLKKAKSKFRLNINLDALLPKCAICYSDLTEKTAASSSEKFVCSGHSERFCKDCLYDPRIGNCPLCASLKSQKYIQKDELLLQAASLGNKVLVAKLIRENINVNTANANGVTALIKAVQHGKFAVVKLLINHGANVNAIAQGLHNTTALHKACQLGYAKIAGILIANGADVNAKKSDGSTPLMLATEIGSLRIVRLLIKHGANVNDTVQGFNIIPALHRACLRGDTKIAALLIANGANVNASMFEGSTPLILASEYGHLAIVQLLIDNNANIRATAQGYFNATALHLACQYGHLKIAHLLILNGADINAKETGKYTPLMLARKNNHNDICDLIKKSQKMHIKNSCAIL